MADITFECPECKQRLVVDSVHAGSEIPCPTCSKMTVVPTAANPSEFPIVESSNHSIAGGRNLAAYVSSGLQKMATGIKSLKSLKPKAGTINIAIICITGLIALWMWRSGAGNHVSKPAHLTPQQYQVIFEQYFNGQSEETDEYGFQKDVPTAQLWFDKIHPVGTAKNATVDDVVCNTDSERNVQTVGLQVTLYWEGPLQDGSTTLKMLYDLTENEFKDVSIVRTDGVTRQDVDNFATGFEIGTALYNALNNSSQSQSQ
jgi:hypothetical protein